jgi:hypothetical protein
VELKPYMHPPGERLSTAERTLAFHSLAAYVRRTFRRHERLTYIDPVTDRTLYLASASGLVALSQARSKPDLSRRWVTMLDPARDAMFRYRWDPAEQEVRRLGLDVDFAVDLDRAQRAPDAPGSSGFLNRAAEALAMHQEFETNFTPVGPAEIADLVADLNGHSPLSLEQAILWEPAGPEAN